MSAIDWVCKKISLESASGQLSAITISGQQVLPSKTDACANVTTCCSSVVDRFWIKNPDFDFSKETHPYSISVYLLTDDKTSVLEILSA